MALPVSQGGIDYPDGGFASGGPVYPMAGDLGELAVRVGSINAFDRRGNVILMDNFAQGREQWADAPYGEGAAVSLSATRCKSPPFSMELITGLDDAKAAKITRKFAYHKLSRFGVECSFTHDTALVNQIFKLFVRDGATLDEYAVYYDIQGGIIYVREPGPDWTQVYTGLKFKTDAWVFRVHKLVIDAVNKKYVRLILDGTEYDLSSYEPYSIPDTTHPYLEISIQMTGPKDYNLTTYVDDFIATQNEPTRE